jgi:hypothetical protein
MQKKAVVEGFSAFFEGIFSFGCAKRRKLAYLLCLRLAWRYSVIIFDIFMIFDLLSARIGLAFRKQVFESF